MEKILFAISVLFFAAILSSCERTVTLDLPEHDPKLVINGLFSNDSIWKVAVSRSKGILEDAEFTFMDNADVKIYEDGSLLETLSLQTLETTTYSDFTTIEPQIVELHYYASENVAKPNHEYRVEVAVDGFETASATATLPTPIEISEVTTENLFVDFDEGFTEQDGNITITFDDPEGENFYELMIFAHQNNGSYPIYLETDDLALSGDANKEGQAILFTDEFFEGNSKTLSLTTYNLLPLDAKIIIEMRSISKEVYLYNSSYNNQRWSRDDPFSEPIFVYSNIENGFGIFGGYYTSFFEYIP